MSVSGPRILRVGGLLAGLVLAAVTASAVGLVPAEAVGAAEGTIGPVAGTVGSAAGDEAIAGEPVHRRVVHDVLSDHARFYSPGSLRDLSFGLLGAWLLANTEADVNFQDWYRDRIRAAATDDLSKWIKPVGNGRIAVPALLGSFLAGKLIGGTSGGRAVERWSGRSLRALMVGAPPLLFLQVATGGSRPLEDDSRWHPFADDNGVSGHSFVGAVPFLSAAGMTDSRPLKVLLIGGSSLCGLSRINDDAHYLSQSAMGWWVAYLACGSVDQTELGKGRLELLPVIPSSGVRAAVAMRICW